jgi:glycosyltransferase involved in cell wall biosynthesis
VFDVSVVIPAYNSASTLHNAVRSVLDQTLPPAQVIVVDDGSTDHTHKVTSSFGSSVLCVRQERGGVSAARNAGIRAARHTWVALLDADDRWHPGKLEAQAAALQSRPDACWAFCDARIVDQAGSPVREWSFPSGIETARQLLETAFLYNPVAGSSSAVLVRRDCLAEVGLFDTGLAAVEDLDLWMRLASRHPFVHVPGVLVDITRTRGSLSTHVQLMRKCLKRIRWKNRRLLGPGIHAWCVWNKAYAGVLCDTGKTALRHRFARHGATDLLESAVRSPLRRGPRSLGILAEWLIGRWPGSTVQRTGVSGSGTLRTVSPQG